MIIYLLKGDIELSNLKNIRSYGKLQYANNKRKIINYIHFLVHLWIV